MKGKKINSRTKGQTAERKLVKLFEAWWGGKFFRTPGSGAFATRGFVGVDTTSMAGDIISDDPTFPFCVESKKVEGWTLEQMLTSDKTKMHAWWEQTVSETPEGKIPLLVFTKNHAPLYAMMRESDAGEYLSSDLRTPMFEAVMPEVGGLDAAGKPQFWAIPVLIFSLDHLLATTKGNWQYGR